MATSATEPPSTDRLRSLVGAAARHYEAMLARLPDDGRLPRSFANGETELVRPDNWTSGFFPGSLWLLYAATGEPRWREAARKYTALLVDEQYDRSTHDIGFILYCSYGHGFRLTGDPLYRQVLCHGAASLASRFNPNVGCLLSWNPRGTWKFPVIIDNMMNLELLLWAAHAEHDATLRNIAIRHADTTLRHHFRPDGSSFHLVDYDPTTGAVRGRMTNQGAADSSAWARGQAWGLYGYTMMYRETGQREYLDQARKIAKFLTTHPRLPADKVPYWDFDAPDIPDAPRDTAAAAVMCSAMIELATFLPEQERASALAFADAQLCSLASPRYFAAAGENGDFLLKHGTGNYPAGSEIDAPLVYGDYYFLEAIVRRMRCEGVAPASSVNRGRENNRTAPPPVGTSASK